MVRPKSGPSKKQKHGVDFKKFKRKIGRKLPPPKNSTDTQIKSKAIVLMEQSVASDKSGLVVNKNGLTLDMLLQQTSHHNAKTRKAALTGIKDLIIRHPSLKLNKIAVIQKLRERISDSEKSVRETLYQLLDNEIFPLLKEDINAPVVSLLMVYVFNAMTHMSVDIRLMAFKFFNLVVQSFPFSFILYVEKILDNYVDILRNNQIYSQDKSKLNNVLDGLVRCMSLLVSEKGKKNPSNEPIYTEQKPMHAYRTVIHKDDSGITSAVKKLDDLVPILVNYFQELISVIRVEPVIDAQLFESISKTIQCLYLAVEVYLNASHLPSESFILLRASSVMSPDAQSTLLVHLSKLWEAFPIGKMHSSIEEEDKRFVVLNVRIVEIFLHLIKWIDQKTVHVEKFLAFIESIFLSLLPTQVEGQLLSSKVFLEKHFGTIVQLIPRLTLEITAEWKARLIEAFTVAFDQCKVDSKICVSYLFAIEEMFHPTTCESDPSSYTDIIEFHVAWMQRLPNMLLQLGDKHPSVSKVILNLILQMGRRSPPNSPTAPEYDNLQLSLKEFFSGCGTVQSGLFLKLPKDCQELAVRSLDNISAVSSDFLLSLTRCCLSDDMEPEILVGIVGFMDSAYKHGHVNISDHLGFLISLVALKVFPENFRTMKRDGKSSNLHLSRVVRSYLYQMGDRPLILRLLYRDIFSLMEQNLSMDNINGLLLIIATLDKRPTALSDENISILSNHLFLYLSEAASYIFEQIGATFDYSQNQIFEHYVGPCIVLFKKSDRLFGRVLKLFDSSIQKGNLPANSVNNLGHTLKPLTNLCLVGNMLIFMYHNVRLHICLSLCKEAVECAQRNVISLLDSNIFTSDIKMKHAIEALVKKLNEQEAFNNLI